MTIFINSSPIWHHKIFRNLSAFFGKLRSDKCWLYWNAKHISYFIQRYAVFIGSPDVNTLLYFWCSYFLLECILTKWNNDQSQSFKHKINKKNVPLQSFHRKIRKCRTYSRLWNAGEKGDGENKWWHKGISWESDMANIQQKFAEIKEWRMSNWKS